MQGNAKDVCFIFMHVFQLIRKNSVYMMLKRFKLNNRILFLMRFSESGGGRGWWRGGGEGERGGGGALKGGMHSIVYEPIRFKLSVGIDTTELYILILV